MKEISPQIPNTNSLCTYTLPRNNPAKFQNYPMDNLGVADKGPLYICIPKQWLGAISPKKISPK